MKKVLVIDDEPDILELIRDILKSKYEVYTVKSVKEGISVLDREKVDLIILDIMMPQMDGWDFLWILRGNEKYREIPVIIVTARADAEDKLIGLKEGVRDYIVKPFLPNELISRVEEILERKS